MNELIRGRDEHPPSKNKELNNLDEAKPPGSMESCNRDNRCSDYLLSRGICGQGMLLNRSLSLLNIYIPMDN